MSNDKVRLMIEVSEDTINECKVLFGQGYANNAEYAISQGTPIIDGDVEKAVEILRNYHNGYFGYKIDDVQKAHNLAITALVTSSTRPKGVWTTDEKGYFYCDQCGKYPHDQYATTDFCPKCGADMRKGDAE